MVTVASKDSINKIRATRYTPAATMVAAWIKALTGVGPSMASGNDTCKGNWADLPMAPQKSKIPAAVSKPPERLPSAILMEISFRVTCM